jgi:hypothetical protein
VLAAPAGGGGLLQQLHLGHEARLEDPAQDDARRRAAAWGSGGPRALSTAGDHGPTAVVGRCVRALHGLGESGCSMRAAVEEAQGVRANPLWTPPTVFYLPAPHAAIIWSARARVISSGLSQSTWTWGAAAGRR